MASATATLLLRPARRSSAALAATAAYEIQNATRLRVAAGIGGVCRGNTQVHRRSQRKAACRVVRTQRRSSAILRFRSIPRPRVDPDLHRLETRRRTQRQEERPDFHPGRRARAITVASVVRNIYPPVQIERRTCVSALALVSRVAPHSPRIEEYDMAPASDRRFTANRAQKPCGNVY